MKLNELTDNPGATSNRKRVGRGVGSGKGKTGGRGVKGQKARSGVALNGFEGGQMPIYMRLPKRGFKAPNTKKYTWINLDRLNKAIESGQIDGKAEVTEEVLVTSGVLRRSRDGVRLLAKGDAPKGLKITVTGASKAAIEAVKAAGGNVTVTAPSTEESE